MTDKEYSVKQYLERARELQRAIETYEEALEVEKARVPRSSSIIKFSKVKGGKNNSSEDRLYKYLERAEKIEKKITALENEKQKIADTIEMVDDIKLKMVLIRRYILCDTWEDVATHLNYDRRWVTELHLRAIKELVKLKITHP